MCSEIEVGRITKNRGTPLQRGMSYEMRFIDESYLKDILDLQETIVRKLTDKEIFRARSPDQLSHLFQKECSFIGIFTDEGLIAYNGIDFPVFGEDNFGSDVSLPEEELDKVAHLATVAVHPDYRGNSLQKRMQSIHLRAIQDMGFEHVCCMVSPKNRASLQNIFSCGLAIKALKIKFGWRLRYIMHRSLSRPGAIGPEEVRVRSSDIQGQIDLLGRGLLGYQMVVLPDGFEISYGRASTSAAPACTVS